MTAPATVLQVEKLSVRFGGVQAVSELTFTVHEGELLSLIGPNGAGKTTAFNAVSGFLRPSGGTVSYRGRRLNGLKPYHIANLGIVRTFQRTSLFEGCSVLQNILIGLHHQGRYKPWESLLVLPYVAREEAELRRKAQELLDFVGLASRADDLAGTLPFGEQRLLGVAIALAAKPQVLMLDEPVSGMNPTETTNFMEMLRKIRQRVTSVVLVEHDMRMVMNVSDRVVVLNFGSLVAEGSPKEIQGNPEVIRVYLGKGAKVA
jgi:branched-chain amino acid transport system ATP-binding protein